MKSKTYCTLLWNHIFVSPQGKTKPCCRFQANSLQSDQPFDKAFLSTEWDQIRSKMRIGEPVEGCRRCYQEEAAGKKSLRQRYNHHPELGEHTVNLEQPKISWLEIPFSNLCNLACRMCDSRYSTSWLRDEMKVKGKTKGENRKILFDLETVLEIGSDLKHIKITGGEPLFDPRHENFLKGLVEQGSSKEIFLNYSTNLSLFPNQKIIDLWKEFSRVEVALSLDSVDEKETHYMRYPHSKNVLSHTISFLKLANELGNISLILRPTVSIFNVYSFPNLLLWWDRAVDEHVDLLNQNRIKANPTHLTHPAYLSPTVLPKKKKIEIQSLYNQRRDSFSESLKKHLEYILKVTLSEDHSDLFPQFIKESKKIDQVRGQSLHETFPHLRMNNDSINSSLEIEM
ncbi:MAG: twitch domain-containing radical SAM protein [Pseudomonadota bacterium]